MFVNDPSKTSSSSSVFSSGDMFLDTTGSLRTYFWIFYVDNFCSKKMSISFQTILVTKNFEQYIAPNNKETHKNDA